MKFVKWIHTSVLKFNMGILRWYKGIYILEISKIRLN